MPNELEVISGLNANQREACRMDFEGHKAVDIARHLGVSNATISSWRAIPLYQQAIAEMHRKADASTLRKAARVRNKALNGVARSVQVMVDMMDDPSTLAPAEAATMARALLDSYKTLAAQTGIKEVTGHEHAVVTIDPREAVSEMVRAIRDRES